MLSVYFPQNEIRTPGFTCITVMTYYACVNSGSKKNSPLIWAAEANTVFRQASAFLLENFATTMSIIKQINCVFLAHQVLQLSPLSVYDCFHLQPQIHTILDCDDVSIAG